MKTESFFFESQNQCIEGTLTLPEDEVKAIVQIVHGMTEHSGRYQHFAEMLAQKHIGTACFDLRGHGVRPNPEACASFGEDGWDASLQEICACASFLKQNYPNTHHFLMGFSLGSFLVRELMADASCSPDGFIIAGSGDQSALVIDIMKAIVKTQIKKAGFNETTPLIQTLSFDTYNQKFAPVRTAFDWLCSDEKSIDDYMKDSLCRRSISSGLFYQLLDAMKRTGSKAHLKQLRSDIPVLLISGKDDPVGDQGKGVQRIYDKMKAYQIPVTMHLIEHARHDFFHETAQNADIEAAHLIEKWIFSINQ